MKKVFSMLVAAFVTAGALVASAQQTQSALATSVYNPAVVQDQSKLPDQDNRFGYLATWLDVDAMDLSTGDVDVGPYLPAGTLVVGGYAHVAEAILPATATLATNGSITIQAAGDLLAVGTDLGTTGIKYLKPSGTGTFVTGITLQTVAVTNSASEANFPATLVTNAVVTTGSTYGGANAPILVTGATSKVTFNLGSQVAATSGVVFVYLDLIKVQ